MDGTVGTFFGDGLDLARGFDGGLTGLAGFEEMVVFLTFSTALATGLATGLAGFATGFAAFLATGAAFLTGLTAGFLDFCKGMAMSPVCQKLLFLLINPKSTGG
ncbi:MAG: hypothetical protein V4614_15380 [Pseudomonadota bacterium]